MFAEESKRNVDKSPHVWLKPLVGGTMALFPLTLLKSSTLLAMRAGPGGDNPMLCEDRRPEYGSRLKLALEPVLELVLGAKGSERTCAARRGEVIGDDDVAMGTIRTEAPVLSRTKLV
jgi:hypothetical protein